MTGKFWNMLPSEEATGQNVPGKFGKYHNRTHVACASVGAASGTWEPQKQSRQFSLGGWSVEFYSVSFRTTERLRFSPSPQDDRTAYCRRGKLQ
jgi:hypothetical protein